MSDWKTIDSAPRGTNVIVYVPDYDSVTEAWFCEETGLWPHDCAFNEDGEPCNVGLPTHWQPLPDPPSC